MAADGHLGTAAVLEPWRQLGFLVVIRYYPVHGRLFIKSTMSVSARKCGFWSVHGYRFKGATPNVTVCSVHCGLAFTNDESLNPQSIVKDYPDISAN